MKYFQVSDQLVLACPHYLQDMVGELGGLNDHVGVMFLSSVLHSVMGLTGT